MAIITREKLIELIEKKTPGKDFILIDVRRPEELKQYGSIPKSINIPLDDFEETLNAAKTDKDFFKKNFNLSFGKNTKLVVYCRSGGRSSIAESIAESLGFKALNYSGSVLDWSKYDKNVKAY